MNGQQNKLPSHVGEGQGWGQYSEREADVWGLKEITDPTPNPSP